MRRLWRVYVLSAYLSVVVAVESAVGLVSVSLPVLDPVVELVSGVKTVEDVGNELVFLVVDTAEEDEIKGCGGCFVGVDSSGEDDVGDSCGSKHVVLVADSG